MADMTMPSVRELAAASHVAQHEVIAEVLKEAQPYIEALRNRTLVIKLGGSALDHEIEALEDIIWVQGLGARPVLVHGGGAEINEWLERLGIPKQFKRGLRVTDAATLEIVRMVLAGKVNGELVHLIGTLGGRAVGLTGLDGGLLRAQQIDPELGYVGMVTSVDPGPVEALSAAGYIPVIAPLGLSADGCVLNINADDAAADLARGLDAAKLLYLSDVPGILDCEGKLLTVLTDVQTRRLISDGTIHGGMIPKAEACLRALETTGRIHIVNGREPHVLIRELFTQHGTGTRIERAREERRERGGTVSPEDRRASLVGSPGD